MWPGNVSVVAMDDEFTDIKLRAAPVSRVALRTASENWKTYRR
jgi:hypothetical protein